MIEIIKIRKEKSFLKAIGIGFKKESKKYLI